MLQKPSRTREVIVRAAVACAAAGEWEGTSLRAVRRRAGVSNGSLFHHFPTRQDLTAAVVSAGLQDHQEALLTQLGPDPETTVIGVVHRHLLWVEDNSALARLLLTTPPPQLRESVPDDVLRENRRFFATVAAWLHEHGWRTTPELRVVNALWLGPAQECSRLWLAEPDIWWLQAAAGDLADGAWAALRPLLHNCDHFEGRGRGELNSAAVSACVGPRGADRCRGPAADLGLLLAVPGVDRAPAGRAPARRAPAGPGPARRPGAGDADY